MLSGEKLVRMIYDSKPDELTECVCLLSIDMFLVLRRSGTHERVHGQKNEQTRRNREHDDRRGWRASLRTMI
jgi:hypothetical protein